MIRGVDGGKPAGGVSFAATLNKNCLIDPTSKFPFLFPQGHLWQGKAFCKSVALD
ncbi:hypothetical protein MESS4_720102 [Mesorhizobium sp. STM 4661]|nr:hypothetical protein MESS4_720102 [Mesorhizobium sp. STM 4661]